MNTFQKKLWTGLAVMALLSPLGIVLPEIFNADGAWGEWSPDKLEKLLGYIPEGMKKIAGIWKAPVADYNFGSESSLFAAQILSYAGSAIAGIAISAGVIYIISKFIVKNEK